jgi:hypothetical protein
MKAITKLLFHREFRNPWGNYCAGGSLRRDQSKPWGGKARSRATCAAELRISFRIGQVGLPLSWRGLVSRLWRASTFSACYVGGLLRRIGTPFGAGLRLGLWSSVSAASALAVSSAMSAAGFCRSACARLAQRADFRPVRIKLGAIDRHRAQRQQAAFARQQKDLQKGCLQRGLKIRRKVSIVSWSGCRLAATKRVPISR